MMYKWTGAVLIIAAGGGFGFSITLRHKKEEDTLRKLIAILDFMECELQYRMTPLPELCRQAASQTAGTLRVLFFRLADELDYQIAPDVSSCMSAALNSCGDLSNSCCTLLTELGSSFGRFDLPGQIKGLDRIRSECRLKLEKLYHNRDARLRSYQTLGLCAGAALAIIFI